MVSKSAAWSLTMLAVDPAEVTMLAKPEMVRSSFPYLLLRLFILENEDASVLQEKESASVSSKALKPFKESNYPSYFCVNNILSINKHNSKITNDK